MRIFYGNRTYEDFFNIYNKSLDSFKENVDELVDGQNNYARLDNLMKFQKIMNVVKIAWWATIAWNVAYRWVEFSRYSMTEPMVVLCVIYLVLLCIKHWYIRKYDLNKKRNDFFKDLEEMSNQPSVEAMFYNLEELYMLEDELKRIKARKLKWEEMGTDPKTGLELYKIRCKSLSNESVDYDIAVGPHTADRLFRKGGLDFEWMDKIINKMERSL